MGELLPDLERCALKLRQARPLMTTGTTQYSSAATSTSPSPHLNPFHLHNFRLISERTRLSPNQPVSSCLISLGAISIVRERLFSSMLSPGRPSFFGVSSRPRRCIDLCFSRLSSRREGVHSPIGDGTLDQISIGRHLIEARYLFSRGQLKSKSQSIVLGCKLIDLGLEA